MGNRFRTYINGRKGRGVRRQIVGHVVVGQRELASYCALRAQYDIECGGLGIRAATHAFQVFAISSPRYCKMFKAVITDRANKPLPLSIPSIERLALLHTAFWAGYVSTLTSTGHTIIHAEPVQYVWAVDTWACQIAKSVIDA